MQAMQFYGNCRIPGEWREGEVRGTSGGCGKDVAGAGVERQWSFTDMKVGKKAGEPLFFKGTHGV